MGRMVAIGARPHRAGRTALWTGYAACAWAFVFAGVRFYWAAGGRLGGATTGPAITAPVASGDPWWIALLWGTGLLKVGLGLLARPGWGRRPFPAAPGLQLDPTAALPAVG
jgi:hypothetical protein